MADPYWRYAAATATTASIPQSSDRGTIPNPNFPGYLPEASTLTNYKPYTPSDLRVASADFPQKDILASRPGAYSVDGLTPGASAIGYTPSFEDPNARNVGRATSIGRPDVAYEMPSSVRRPDDPPVPPAGESNILFVDGLPTNCTRREIGHLFRPFIGFRELRVVHKEPRHRGDKAMVLCFVEFTDAKCAVTAMEALQGYKFDDKKPESNILKIHFAHFPFRLPSEREETRFVGLP